MTNCSFHDPLLATSPLSGEAIQDRFLGQISYEEGLTAQDQALANLNEKRIGEVLGLEHSAVITLGKRGRVELDLTASMEELQSRGIQLITSTRGGQATLHSPGQLVIYPCLNLKELGLGVRDYVCRLEKTTQRFLKAHGIETTPNPEEPGLYTSRGKIAFFGIRVSQGFASHGVAINVSNDTGLFKLIRSCGKDHETFDRMQDHGATAAPRDLFLEWMNHFLKTLA